MNAPVPMDIDYWLLATIGCSGYSQIDPSCFPAANHFGAQSDNGFLSFGDKNSLDFVQQFRFFLRTVKQWVLSFGEMFLDPSAHSQTMGFCLLEIFLNAFGVDPKK